MKKKRAKKKLPRPDLPEGAKLPPARSSNFRILAQVEITPAVEELLKSNEAKLYLGGIKRAESKLHAMIARELAVRHHPGHADHKPADG